MECDGMDRFLGALIVAVIVLLALAWEASPASAEEKAYLGTVLEVNVEAKTFKIISHDGALIEVKADGKAAEHLGQIPLNSLIDVTVEMKGAKKPTIKSWKMAQAQSPCRIFDGSRCIP